MLCPGIKYKVKMLTINGQVRSGTCFYCFHVFEWGLVPECQYVIEVLRISNLWCMCMKKANNLRIVAMMAI